MINRSLKYGILACLLTSIAQAQREPLVEATLQLDESFKPSVSRLWSPAGQAAWDALRDYHRVKRIDLEPPTAVTFALDDSKANMNDTLPPGTQIFAGEYTDAFADLIKTSLMKTIGKQAADMIDPAPKLGPIDGTNQVRLKAAIMVSALVARPKFPSRFEQDQRPLPFTNSQGKVSQVFGFGASGGMAVRMADAVTVLQDDLHGSMVVECVLYTGDDNNRQRLVLACDPRITSLESGIEVIKGARSHPIPANQEVEAQGNRWRYVNTLSASDQFWMPELRTSLLCDYGDLIGRTYLHENRGTLEHRWWKIASAQQLLSMRLDHTGALVEAVFKLQPDFQSMGGANPAAWIKENKTAPLPLYPKQLRFDHPFLMSLWRVGADLPYLACWVDSADVLRTH